MIPVHALRNGGMSRRGFLRAMGVTTCAALVPGLAEGIPIHRSGLRLMGPLYIGGQQFGKSVSEADMPEVLMALGRPARCFGCSEVSIGDLRKAQAVLEANDIPAAERVIYFRRP